MSRRLHHFAVVALAACQSGGEPVTLSPPLAAAPRTLERGAVALVRLTAADPAHDFRRALDEPSSLSFRASRGLTLELHAAEARALEVRVAVDASAPLGPADLELTLGEGPQGVRFALPGAFEVLESAEAPALRDALSLPLTAEASTLAWLAPSEGPAWVEVTASPPGGAALLLLDAEGRFGRPLEFAPAIAQLVEQPLPRGLVVLSSGMPGARSLALTARRWPLRAAVATPDNGAPASASPLGAADVYVPRATLAGATAAQFFSVELGPGAVGHRLDVQTFGDPSTDTRLALLRDDHVTAFGLPSPDDRMHDRLVSPVIAVPGRYFVRVTGGSAFDAAHADYSLLVVIR